ncbi:MAG: hypothetical protein QM757_08220 [Paludibaculum sp.]
MQIAWPVGAGSFAAWTNATTAGSLWAMNSRASASVYVSPQGFSSRTTSPPCRRAISVSRSG